MDPSVSHDAASASGSIFLKRRGDHTLMIEDPLGGVWTAAVQVSASGTAGWAPLRDSAGEVVLDSTGPTGVVVPGGLHYRFVPSVITNETTMTGRPLNGIS